MGRTRGRPSEGAREAVLAAAHALFMERDYDDVSTAEILERSGVSRGALYHHFPTKLDLFSSVWEASERRVDRTGGRGGAGLRRRPFEAPALPRQGIPARRPRPTRRCGGSASARAAGCWAGRAGEGGRTELGLGVALATVPAAAIEAGELPPNDPETIAIILLGAMIEAAMLIVVADDPAAVRRAL